MAVSKMHPVSAIVEAESLGIRLFGENRVQEFQEKSLELAKLDHAVGTQFHFIGHLQSNKAARAAELFSSIDTLDSLPLAERLNEAAAPASHESDKATPRPGSPATKPRIHSQRA